MKNRWRCPECKGTKVQIGLPAWFIERPDYTLKFVEPDTEAEIMYWFCPDCCDSGDGNPEENR